ncbi:MAG TPA: STAS domain-containing protein [Terriglobales bacterium]|nr:STAS domain-containing protein [Terriglobales bacterium]
MTIDSRAVDGVTIFDLNGRITLGEDTVAFRSAIAGLIADGRKMVLLNLNGVPYIDSSGLGELVAAFTRVRDSGGKLKLLNLSPKIRTLMMITKLNSVFDVQEDETAAIQSFTVGTPHGLSGQS